MSTSPSYRRVALREVGLRDGVQAFGSALPTALKCDWILLAYAAGLREIEVGSYLAAEKAPHMADTPEVVAFATTLSDLSVSVLVHDLEGARQAMAEGAGIVTLPLPASEAYCMASVGRPIEAVLADLRRICALRDAQGRSVQIEAAVSTAFGCALQGAIEHATVLERVTAALSAGCDGVTLADTFGRADARAVHALCSQVRTAAPSTLLTAHLHGGSQLENVEAAVATGVDRLDASLAGIGGSVLLKGSEGNVSVEDVATLLRSLGVAVEVDMKTLAELRQFASRHPDAKAMFDALREVGGKPKSPRLWPVTPSRGLN